MHRTAFQCLTLGAGHAGHIGPGDGRTAGAGAVFRRAGRTLADALHNALLHGLGGLTQSVVVVGQTVGVTHPHPGQLHQAAHLGVRQLLLERKIRHIPAKHRLFRRPAGVEGADGVRALSQARDGRQRRRAFGRCRTLFRLLHRRRCRHIRSFPALIRLHRPGGDSLLSLCMAEGRSGGGGGIAALRGKELQIHHRLFSPSAQIGKADIVRVAFCQQSKARLCKFERPLHPRLLGCCRRHGQTRAVRLVPHAAPGAFLARQQGAEGLHQGAGPRTHDVLPGGGIARVARSFQPTGGACRAVQLGVVYFYHLISPFCVFIALAIAAVLSSCAGPPSLGASDFFCTSSRPVSWAIWACIRASCWARVPF